MSLNNFFDNNKKIELNNMNNIKDMELTKLSKSELLEKCEELGLTKYKSKNKEALINLIVGTKIINKNIIKHLKPLIKWSSGKSDEIKMFEKYFPQNYNIYIEPFIGGGSVYFYLNPINAVISDIHSELIHLYKNIGNGKGG